MNDKLKMAHEYAMEYIQGGYDINHSVLVAEAWQYVDAMQAEADKREDKTRPAVLSQGGYVEKPKYELAGVVAHGDDWQPDWNQAPSIDINYYSKEKDGRCSWWIGKPSRDNQNHYECLENKHCAFYGDAPDFGYTGNWQDSLRKRPE